MRKCITGLVLSLALWVGVMPHAWAQTQAEQRVAEAAAQVESALDAAKAGRLNAAQQAYDAFHQRWFEIEDSVKQESGQAYSDIEAAMGDAEYALMRHDAHGAVSALEKLDRVCEAFAAGRYGSATPQLAQNVTLDQFIALLQTTKAAAAQGDVNQALTDIAQVRRMWINVEGQVVAKSSTAYTNAERDMVTVNALLAEQPADTQGAVKLLDNMIQYLSPLAQQTGYTVWDAAMIPIREGLEALLVVAALLAVVKKSEARRGTAWVWAGVGTGLAISVLLALWVRSVLSSGAFGHNNFLISGWTGIIAAIMLLYMSYWLHGKSQIADWNRFIRSQTQQAISAGHMLTLGGLSFLAVFREGTETVLFIIGMANQIPVHRLVFGLLLGFGVLAVIAVLMLGLGMRLPLRPFFLVSSLIVFYLCVKFTGMGIHSLQLAGELPSTPAAWLPSFEFVALYPSLESAVPQLLLVAAAVLVVAVRRLRHKRALEAQHH
jgi:high-affinity iron transporter